MHALGPSSGTPHHPASFGRTVRLLLNRDFQRVFDANYSVAGKCMVIWAAPSTETHSRMGVIASKRTFRRAVDRNRAKRLIREAFRCKRHDLSTPCDLVIVARRRILNTHSHQAQAEFIKLARALQLMEDSGRPDKNRGSKD